MIRVSIFVHLPSKLGKEVSRDTLLDFLGSKHTLLAYLCPFSVANNTTTIPGLFCLTGLVQGQGLMAFMMGGRIPKAAEDITCL
jgi:hypothetical protein